MATNGPLTGVLTASAVVEPAANVTVRREAMPEPLQLPIPRNLLVHPWTHLSPDLLARADGPVSEGRVWPLEYSHTSRAAVVPKAARRSAPRRRRSSHLA